MDYRYLNLPKANLSIGGYLDDFGTMIMGEQNPAPQKAVTHMKTEATQDSTRRGVTPHKNTLGIGLDVILRVMINKDLR